MADGDGVRGNEVRNVVPTNGPTGRQNVPARQLGQVGVQAPRGGSVEAVGAETKAMIELTKLGVSGLEAHMEKQKASDLLDGQMRYAQGDTEEQLRKEGVSRSTLDGYKTLEVKTGYNEWLAKSMKNIEMQDHAMSSEEYQEKLHTEFKELMDTVDTENPEMVKLMGGFANEGFTKLVQQHTLQSTEYSAGKSQDSVMNLFRTEALNGDSEALQELLDNRAGLVPGLSDRATDGAVLAATGSLLDEGNFSLYDQLGGLDGMRKMGASEEEIGSMRSRYKAALSINETENLASLEQQSSDIKLQVKMGKISRDEANFKVKQLTESVRSSDSYARTLIKNVNAEFSAQNEDAAVSEVINDPEYVQKKAMIMAQARMTGTPQAKRALAALNAKHGVPSQYANGDMDRMTKEYEKHIDTKIVAPMEEQIKKQEAAAEMDNRAANLLNTNFSGLDSYSDSEKSRAMTMKKQMIIQGVVNDARFDSQEEKRSEVIRQHVDFLRYSPLRDEGIKKDFGIVGQAPPSRDDGTLSPNHEEAYEYFNVMRESGISERVIKEYAGESYDYLLAASFIAGGELDPSTAMKVAWENTNGDKKDKRKPKTNVGEALEDWDKTKEKYFDSIEPSIVSAWLGAPSDGKYDEVLTYQVKEAAKNSSEMDAWAKRKTKAYAENFPDWDKKTVMEKVKKDLSQWEYVMGTMIPPKSGKSISESMGLTEEDGALTSNSAMLMYMRDNADLLFPKGTAPDKWWKKLAADDGPLTRAIFEPEKMGMLYARTGKKELGNIAAGKLQGAVMAFSEKEQRLANDIKMIGINPLSNGQLMVTMYQDTDRTIPVGVPIAIPAKDIGDWYKVQRREQQFNKQAPRR